MVVDVVGNVGLVVCSGFGVFLVDAVCGFGGIVRFSRGVECGWSLFWGTRFSWLGFGATGVWLDVILIW